LLTQIIFLTNDNGANAVLLKNNVQNIEKVVYTYISKLNKKNFGSFVQILNNDPVALGYKSSVVNLLDKDLRAIYTYLKQISG
jgi:hypothetical protein